MSIFRRCAFRAASAGTLSMLIVLAGCGSGGNSSSSSGSGSGGTGGGTTTPGLVSGGASTVYTVSSPSTTSGSVLVFPASSSGIVSPSVSLPVSAEAQCVATDSSGNIYVGSVNITTGYGQIQVYAAGATASSSPTRTITGSATNHFSTPRAMATDSSGQLYVVTADADVLVFASAATGAATPTRSFTSTQLSEPEGITVDTAGSIYIMNVLGITSSNVLVFPTGSTTPARTITVPGFAYGVAVDSGLNVWVGLDTGTTTASSSVVEYAAGANGSATPLKTIAGSATTLASATIGGMRFDVAGNLWLVNQIVTATGTITGTYVSAWPASATGNQAPAIQFSSPTAWSVPSPQFAVR